MCKIFTSKARCVLIASKLFFPCTFPHPQFFYNKLKVIMKTVSAIQPPEDISQLQNYTYRCIAKMLSRAVLTEETALGRCGISLNIPWEE